MQLEDSTALRIERAENQIGTLRITQDALVNRYDKVHILLHETRDIAADNRTRLGRVEERLDRVEERLDRIELRLEMVDNRLDRLEQIAAENREMIRENRDMIRENHEMIREIRHMVSNIHNQMGLTMENPNPDS